jgi:hypothetical protein
MFDPGDVLPIVKSSSECPSWSPASPSGVSDGCSHWRRLLRPECGGTLGVVEKIVVEDQGVKLSSEVADFVKSKEGILKDSK